MHEQPPWNAPDLSETSSPWSAFAAHDCGDRACDRDRAMSDTPHAISPAPVDARVYFLGDVYLPAPIEVSAELPERLVYNLEAPITSSDCGWPSTVNLRCEDDHSLATFGRRPVAACLANNHIMDYGAAGLTETVSRLETAGVTWFGAGEYHDNCGNPALLQVGDHSLALLGYVCPTSHPVYAVDGRHPGVAPIQLDRIRADVRLARELGAAKVAVSLHWGVEELGLPRPEDVRIARAIAKMGADIIIGHHAHCIQPYEVHEGVPIFYGLGNAIFPDIDCWCDYDVTCEPHGRFRKLQNYWNRPSLAVSYDVASGAFRVDRLSFDGRRLRILSRGVSGPRLDMRDEDAYSLAFARHRFRATWRNKLVNYVRRPKLPRLRHVRSLGRILKEARGGSL